MRHVVYAVALALAISGSACKSNRSPARNRNVRISAASLFTKKYAQSRLSSWNVRGRAAGADCGVLFVDASIILEESMVEALHYGAGAYDVYPGGVQGFSRDHSFRGTAYRDLSGRVWTYGEISSTEALTSCH
ncbi:MAG: hypothetical protein JWO97_3995 [Acidobacteria bacterium]|nr:hypothetical protein [Acidobacteriota bacterium]